MEGPSIWFIHTHWLLSQYTEPQAGCDTELFSTVLHVYWHCAMPHSVTYCHYTGSTVENNSVSNNDCCWVRLNVRPLSSSDMKMPLILPVISEHRKTLMSSWSIRQSISSTTQSAWKDSQVKKHSGQTGQSGWVESQVNSTKRMVKFL